MVKMNSYARTLIVLVAICFGPVISNAAVAEIAKSRRANIEKLLEITGAVENGRAMSMPAAKPHYDLSGLIGNGKRVVIQTPAMPLRSSNVEPRKRSILMVLELDANGNPIAYRQFSTICDFQERKSIMCKQSRSDKRFQFEHDVYYVYKARKQAFICMKGCGPHTPAALIETAAIPVAFPNIYEP